MPKQFHIWLCIKAKKENGITLIFTNWVMLTTSKMISKMRFPNSIKSLAAKILWRKMPITIWEKVI